MHFFIDCSCNMWARCNCRNKPSCQIRSAWSAPSPVQPDIWNAHITIYCFIGPGPPPAAAALLLPHRRNLKFCRQLHSAPVQVRVASGDMWNVNVCLEIGMYFEKRENNVNIMCQLASYFLSHVLIDDGEIWIHLQYWQTYSVPCVCVEKCNYHHKFCVCNKNHLSCNWVILLPFHLVGEWRWFSLFVYVDIYISFC